jgi:hypothetical protein
MKKLLCVALLLLAAPPIRATARPALPPVVTNELKALEETYALLDAVAEKVWPGWTGYRDWPFLFTFENGLRVLVGHPNPPKEFELVEGVRVGERTVAVDRTRETALPLKGPLGGGGGLGSFGMTASGSPVQVVNISLRMPRPGDLEKAATEPPTTENKVLVYLHELFHGFQRRFVTARVGNLMYNADTDYAVWSNVEGIALERAYAETDNAAARERVKDFLVARSLKRRSMTELQQKQESSDDVLEGTANYAMVRALEAIRAGGFQPKLTTTDDPNYHGFANVDAMIEEYRARLKEAAARHENPKMKCYDYGCFQALMCERLFPGWQDAVQKGKFIDAVLAAKLPIGDDERVKIEQRLRDDYPYAAVRADAAKFIDARDAAWNQLKARAGRIYIVDMKGTGQYVSGLADTKGAYRLGLVTLFPSAYPGLKLDDVEMSRASVPSVTDQLYYVKIVDTQPASRKQPYSVTGTKQPDGTYTNAVVTTPLFTLKAPKVRIRATGNRVKIQVLARVGGDAQHGNVKRKT